MARGCLKNGHHANYVIGKKRMVEILWNPVLPYEAAFLGVGAKQEGIAFPS